MVRQVARGLQDQEHADRPAFTVVLAPAGYAVTYLSATRIVLERPGGRDQRIEVWVFPAATLLDRPPGDEASSVDVFVTRTSDDDIGDDTIDAQGVQVGALSGWLQKKDGRLLDPAGLRLVRPVDPDPRRGPVER